MCVILKGDDTLILSKEEKEIIKDLSRKKEQFEKLTFIK